MITNTTAPHATIWAKDYQPPLWLVPEIALDFSLDPDSTRVRAVLQVRRNGAHDAPLRLDGDGLVPRAVRVDGQEVTPHLIDGALLIALSGDAHCIETEVEIAPSANTKLMGLYASSGLLCTQCEAEGFRRITFFPDRPDVLSQYTVRMEADATTYPVLLSNGDCVARGVGVAGRHWAEWHDPFPKPSYLFALVAGDLAANEDSFTTMSGRAVALRIWVKADDVPRTAHAMASLKAAMAWDERVYSREYDLNEFNIVAVDDFNFGAMENKSLNVFNAAYVLADPDTATDADYDNIESIVAHEYFHNWSGNRVTCRDWFQLSLKEGFTVYRDQCFSADQGSAALVRINEVRSLRASQFPEDAGPLAHPVRPDSYVEIGNFYTATVYNKGAEVIRMMATLLGAEAFRKGADLYFARHDGQAVTCEDFVQAMETASGVDLRQFRLWYSQAGTPRIGVQQDYDPGTQTTRLTITQSLGPTPGQSDKQPMHIPLRLALFDPATGAKRVERLVELHDPVAQFEFSAMAQPPLLSINRGFTAPVVVESNRTAADLARLAQYDDDPFARYEAMQQMMLDHLVASAAGQAPDAAPLIDAVRHTLGNDALDPAFKAEAVLLPSEAVIGEQMLVIDPDAIAAARDGLRLTLARALRDAWRAAYATPGGASAALDGPARSARRLRNVALGYLMAEGEGAAHALAYAQFNDDPTMTNRYAALALLVSSDAAERDVALGDFYARYRANRTVIDKWFATQALSARADTVERVAALRDHPDFSLKNPNRARALIGSFAANQRAFHRADGAGYRLFADTLLALDAINPQAAARQVPALGRWRRFDAARQTLMRYALDVLRAAPNLSRDMFEQVSKSLG